MATTPPTTPQTPAATTADVLVALLPVIAKYGTVLVKDTAALAHGNPQRQGETDDQYIARVNAETDAVLNEAEQKTVAIENDPA